MNDRHFQPNDVLPVFDLGVVAVVMGCLMMWLEMTMDDRRRMRNVGLVRVHRCQARSEDQKRHDQKQDGSSSNSSKHRGHYVGGALVASNEASCIHATCATRTEA